jgi:hypothetical protein
MASEGMESVRGTRIVLTRERSARRVFWLRARPVSDPTLKLYLRKKDALWAEIASKMKRKSA